MAVDHLATRLQQAGGEDSCSRADAGGKLPSPAVAIVFAVRLPKVASAWRHGIRFVITPSPFHQFNIARHASAVIGTR